MSLYEDISGEMKAAMKAGDRSRLSTFRMIVSAINYESIDNGGDKSDELTLRVLRKEAKKRREAIEAYRKGSREEQARSEEAELVVIESYLPQMMTEEEVRGRVEGIIRGQDMDFGMAMRKSMAEIAGCADGKVVSRIVRELLGNK